MRGRQEKFLVGLFRDENSTVTAPTYHINDYLGNVRVVADADGTVVERNDYHPFGERMSSSGTFAGTNAFRLGGKEQQNLGGIGWTDFGARMYDPFIARWTATDPLAEKYPSFTPYGYCADNPVNFVDPDGRRTFVHDLGNNLYRVCGGRLDLNRKICC